MASTKSVLIIGGSGFIGTHLALKLRETYKVFATYNKHRIRIPGVTTVPLSMGNREWAKRIAYLAQPDVIIYAAGSNSLEWSESHHGEAETIHTGGAATALNVSEILQPRYIYISNSYVFDGVHGNYRENDIVLPPNSLGKAKLGGENYLKSRSLSYVIVRSAPLLGRGNGRNFSFLDELRMKLDRGKRVELTDQEVQNFAHVDGLTEMVEKIVETGMKKKIYHYGGLTKMSFLDLGKAFAKRFGYDANLISAISARRTSSARESSRYQEESPYDFSLNSSHAVENLKIKPLLLEESFDLIEKQLIRHF